MEQALTIQQETSENPRMLEVYHEQVWQQVFCYALAVEESDSPYRDDTILMTIVAGSDSSLQALKAAIDIGSSGLTFGYGIKGLTSYDYQKEKGLVSEKGKYEKFAMNVSGNRKALVIIHEKLLSNSEFVLSFDGNPADDIANLLGGSKYGLHILPEWKSVVFKTLRNRDYIKEIPLYKDETLFENGLKLLSIKLEEEEADNLITELIQTDQIRFPKQGEGSRLNEIDSLTDYMLEFSDDMVEKLSEEVTPTHDPTVNDPLPVMSKFPRELFPVQAHVSSAISKRLMTQKAVIIQGEMSTGKSPVMTAIGEGIHDLQKKRGKEGYFACLMVPPSLTKKWPVEIRHIVPNAKVHVIKNAKDLIEMHNTWLQDGKPRPECPTFFVISFTTMRGDSRTMPAVEFEYKKTTAQKLSDDGQPYRYGHYCPGCGKAHQAIDEKVTHTNEDGEEEIEYITHSMNDDEFGGSRRIHNSAKPQNAFCSECGESLWTKKVPTRYSSFKEWASHERKVIHAIEQENPRLVDHIQSTQPEIRKVVGMPRKTAVIEYIRRRMKNFFDITVVDEVHELKGGMSAQGHSLGSLAAASKKVIAGTGTLFGGKAEDIYYLLWRLFPQDMVASGYKYHEVRRFNEEYGNIEQTTYERKESSEYSNSNSRGGTKRTEKVLPGISPFIYGRYMVHNVVNMRLKDVWPDPVDLVDTPTVLVDMNKEMEDAYQEMIATFKSQIDARDDGYKLYLPMTDYGVAYPDNPFSFPNATYLNMDGEREEIWDSIQLSVDTILPKEAKLQEIVQTEMAEGRKSIVYVRDTGSSVSQRDVRPRLQKVLEDIGAKVCILDTTTTKTDNRSDWLENKIENEGYDVCIVSQELVKVGLDLLCTPSLIFYQFSWSLFTINQASRRSWRIGQDKECRLYYLAYKNTHQETMATLIAQKNKATAAINGEVSSDGLSAMLGEEGDLQSMLVNTIKKSGKVLKGSTEDWVSDHSDRAREILANIGKKKKPKTIEEQFTAWLDATVHDVSTKNVITKYRRGILSRIKNGDVAGFQWNNNQILEVDLIQAMGMEIVDDGLLLSYLVEPLRNHSDSTVNKLHVIEKGTKRKKKSEPVNGQLTFELF